MCALLAFILLGAVVTALIEINERIKAKKNRDTGVSESRDSADCAGDEACSACQLVSVCEKKDKPTDGQ